MKERQECNCYKCNMVNLCYKPCEEISKYNPKICEGCLFKNECIVITLLHIKKTIPEKIKDRIDN